jgi:AcrR family transcriptional regulator
VEINMGKPRTDLAPKIRDKTLELLLEKEPEEISTREIARACGVTATSLYYYYKDRDAIFTEIKLCCIEKMDEFISGRITKKLPAHNRLHRKTRAGKRPLSLEEIKAGLEAFRDWAFANPRIALLVMGRLKADTQADSEKMKKYYRSTVFAQAILDRAVHAGLSDSKDTLLDASLCITALWGAIESVLLNRTIPQYWTRRGSINFTDKMIDLLIASLMRKSRRR